MDDHLGRDIRHDDLYEELAPITHCDFNKKVHAHSDQLSFFLRNEQQRWIEKSNGAVFIQKKSFCGVSFKSFQIHH